MNPVNLILLAFVGIGTLLVRLPLAVKRLIVRVGSDTSLEIPDFLLEMVVVTFQPVDLLMRS